MFRIKNGPGYTGRLQRKLVVRQQGAGSETNSARALSNSSIPPPSSTATDWQSICQSWCRAPSLFSSVCLEAPSAFRHGASLSDERADMPYVRYVYQSLLLNAYTFSYLQLHVTPGGNSTESLIISYISFPLLSLLFLSSHTCYRMMHRGRHLTLLPTNNTHTYTHSQTKTVSFIQYTISQIHNKILLILTE
jgi:hypothetical protein